MFEIRSGLWAMAPRSLQALCDFTDLHPSWGPSERHAFGPDGDEGPTHSSGVAPYEVKDGVAHIDIRGPMMRGRSMQMEFFGVEYCCMADAMGAVRYAADSEAVREIVLYFDSPGGQLAGTGELADAVFAARQKKPVVAYVNGMCCSAAYWVAAQCTEIIAERHSEIGAIGVYRVVADSSEAAAKVGVKVHVVSSHELKGAGVGGAPITESQRAEMQRQIDCAAEMFTKAVADGRGQSIENIQSAATGQVWFAGEAFEKLLIDGIGPLLTIAPQGAEDEYMEKHEQEALRAKQELDKAKADAAELKMQLEVAHAEQRKAILGAHADRISPAMSRHVADFADACGSDFGKLKNFLSTLPKAARPDALGGDVSPAAAVKGAELSDDDAKVARFLGLTDEQMRTAETFTGKKFSFLGGAPVAAEVEG